MNHDYNDVIVLLYLNNKATIYFSLPVIKKR